MCFFRKKTMELPSEFNEFPVYTGKIVKGPIVRETTDYKRLTYYVKGNINEYINTLYNDGYTKKSDVRFDKGNYYSYIIIEKDFLKTKIAFHKKKIN